MNKQYEISIIGKTINNIYFLFYFVYFVLIKWYRNVFPLPELPPIIKKLNPIELYSEKQKKAFDIFMSKDLTIINQNTDTIFYDIEEYNKLMEERDNFLELKWRGKILMENTPRGLIMMSYDAFKRGFTYYCDNQSINYMLLNAIAMKYIRTYHCSDLFIDNSIYPEKPSRFIELYKEYENNEIKKKEAKNSTVTVVKDKMKNENGPFAKLKNYKMESKKDIVKSEEIDKFVKKNIVNKNQKKEENNNIPIKKNNTNLFIFGGKICDSVFKINKHKKKLVTDKPTQYDNIFVGEQNVQKQAMSYKDFKLLKK
jgi:hypothetical protein